MRLNRIKKPQIPNKMIQDIRHHNIGLSKVLYIVGLSSLFIIFINYIFYSAYLLVGDAFVDSDAKVISLEYDAYITEILVENGNKVNKGQTIAYYDSLEFRFQFLRALNEYTEILNKKNQILSSISRLETLIKTTEDYLADVKEAESNLENFKKHGNASIDRLLTEKTRRFIAYRDLLTYKAEHQTTLRAFNEIEMVANTSNTTLMYLLNKFNDGEIKSSENGVIGKLWVRSGSVVKRADPLATLYYGPRFLNVLFENSFVSKKIGDPVIVSFPKNSAITLGRIVEISNYTEQLPDEIKPKYRPPGRRSVAKIMVDSTYLEEQEILASAHIYKPLGLNFACSIFNCKSYLKDDYEKMIESKKSQISAIQENHSQDNEPLQTLMKKLSPDGERKENS